PVELNLCHFMAAMHPFHTLTLVPFSQDVEEKTDGRVKIFVYASNELAAADKNYDATVSGIIDIGLTLPAYTPGQFPLAGILEFPFLFSSPLQSNLTAWELINTNPVIKNTEYKDVELLWLGTTDLGHFLLKKPISGISDLNGLKMRSPSTIGNDVLTALGAIPVTLPVSDTYDAIERSIVDGTLLPISTLNSFNLGDVVSEVLEMNMYATPLHMVMNKASWNKISPSDQQIILDLIAEFPNRVGTQYTLDTDGGYAKADAVGITVSAPSADELQKFKDAVNPLIDKWLDDMEAKGIPGREVFEQMQSISKKYE
ncbi:MAG: TRAP transporter substrate-binding protein, partial [Clostridiales bacterium]|nr:TRAP transporter substrate-binding protein [Clostridiales bacterium]